MNMRILAIGDFHGKVPVTKKFLKDKKIDVIVSSGDFASGEKLRKVLFDNWHVIKLGIKRFYDILGIEKTNKFLKEDLETQHKVFKKLNALGIPVYIVSGNLDYRKNSEGTEYVPGKLPYTFESECRDAKNIHHIDLKKVELEGVTIIGLDSVVNFALDKNVNAAIKEISELFNSAKNPVVFVSHEPPFRTKMAIIKDKKSPRHGEDVGSDLVREIIERLQPAVCVCGHNHENKEKIDIGYTTVVNTGYGNVGEGALINVKDGQIKVKLVKV